MKNILDKMASRGVEALSDRELLALLTDDEQLAEVVLSAYDGSLARIGDQPEARLRMVGGLGLKRARMLLAAALFDIRLLDHIIIARDGDFSFLREGLMGR